MKKRAIHKASSLLIGAVQYEENQGSCWAIKVREGSSWMKNSGPYGLLWYANGTKILIVPKKECVLR